MRRVVKFEVTLTIEDGGCLDYQKEMVDTLRYEIEQRLEDMEFYPSEEDLNTTFEITRVMVVEVV
jgi:hypothetical protein